jgi:formate dehydrogenase major subunit
VPGLGASFGRGGATTFQQDLANADCILIEGSNMAEAHPVGFQWVMEAKARGATIIHVDPRFSRTSALADMHVPIRAGTDIAFLGGLVNYVISTGSEFREYVLAYTNASTIVSESFTDTEDLDGYFSGWQPDKHSYDPTSWMYEGVAVAGAAGQREMPEVQSGDEGAQEESGDSDSGAGTDDSADRARQSQEAEHSHALGSGGATLGSGAELQRDPTLQHPRCVWQILRRHYSRYTPDMVARICGISEEQFVRVADALIANSGRERTSAFCYAVGWTQHSVGVQYIRTA